MKRVKTLTRFVSLASRHTFFSVNNTNTAKLTRELASIHRFVHTTRINMSYSVVERGSPNSLEYRAYFCASNGSYISPFHDIPLFANEEKGVLNMVVEIPRWTNSKMEINKKDKLNPIKQDVKKGNLRYVKNVFPHHGYIWNYGAFPQTWEDPNHTTKDTGAKGDCDPLDVCEIGHKIHKRGAVIQVKVLGTMCLIDEGETDWKIICIDIEDPLAKDLNDIGDVEKQMPGFLKATYEWFKIYKIPDGKPENKFAFDGEAKNKEYAMKVIEECNKQWKALIGNEVQCHDIACENTCVAGSPFSITADEAKKIVDAICREGDHPQAADPKPIPDEVNKWYYVKL